jgi:hypothetical protein
VFFRLKWHAEDEMVVERNFLFHLSFVSTDGRIGVLSDGAGSVSSFRVVCKVISDFLLGSLGFTELLKYFGLLLGTSRKGNPAALDLSCSNVPVTVFSLSCSIIRACFFCSFLHPAGLFRRVLNVSLAINVPFYLCCAFVSATIACSTVPSARRGIF